MSLKFSTLGFTLADYMEITTNLKGKETENELIQSNLYPEDTHFLENEQQTLIRPIETRKYPKHTNTSQFLLVNRIFQTQAQRKN